MGGLFFVVSRASVASRGAFSGHRRARARPAFFRSWQATLDSRENPKREGWHGPRLRGHDLQTILCAMPSSGTDSFPHRRRYEGFGHARYLTFSCFRNQPFLSRDRAATWLAEALRTAREKELFDLWAWVAMPTHVHVLLLPSEGVTVGRILSAIKQSVSKRALVYLRRENPAGLKAMKDRQPNGRVSYRFWQRGGGYDRNIWSPKGIREKIDYIHANPVRRELVARPQDWRWSSWHAWATGEDDPVPIDRQSVPMLTGG